MAQQIVQEERASKRSQAAVAEKLKGKILEKIPLQALNVEMVKPDQLHPNPYNPNRQDDDEFALLRQSIRVDGFTMPVLANMQFVIIDGEHRWQAAKAEGIKWIPVVRIDVNDVQMKMSTIRHNKARGTHDAGLEAMVLADLEKLVGKDFIQEQLLVDRDSLDEILNFTSAPDALAGEEFGNSWVPVKSADNYRLGADGKPEASPVFAVRQTVDSAYVMRSNTEAANLAAYQKIVEHSAEVHKVSLYTLSTVLNPEDWLKIQPVLEGGNIPGNTPAEKFYNLCKQWEGTNGPVS